MKVPRTARATRGVLHGLPSHARANFTGAGLGARSSRRRNLEVGVVSDDRRLVEALESEFDRFWIGEHCVRCALRARCPDPIR